MHSLAPEEPEVRQFEATVTRCDGTDVVLAETYFYPEGGGQPADRGTIDGLSVTDVQARNGEVVHTLASEPAFSEGDSVESLIDPDFRTYCMRAHTASHALYGAGRRLFEDLGYGGFGITDEKVRVDFATSTTIDDETLVELERLVNRVVWESRDVSWETLPREEALDREDVAFNTKTEEGITGDTVRIVEIEDWDVAACGGTHVQNTRVIGPVTVLERSNPGEGLTRVEFAVGPNAIAARAAERTAAMDAAQLLDTRVAELPDAVQRLRNERDDLQAERNELQDRVVDVRLADLEDDIIECDGQAWLVGAVPGLGANALADRAQELVGESADVVALVSDDGQYLAVATTGEVNAGDVVGDVTDEFGGGGGGGPTVAQGGGLGASADEVVEFLRSHS
jgi:alanyl-tRNA synthetase